MTEQTTIHWLGAGLSSGPGIADLVKSGLSLTLWNRTVSKAEELVARVSQGRSIPVEELALDKLANTIKAGDIVVSMLPATRHVEIAKIALANNAHMVTTSYLSPEMLELNTKAKEKGLSVVNEVGLDPGVDHLFAHLLVAQAKKAGALGKGGKVDFVSYCGGIPAVPTPFTYKFSWAPLGVLTALKNTALSIENGTETTCHKPWDAVTDLDIAGETFEVYPNRDSLPYIKEYGLENETNLNTFVRGTLRLKGWKDAWSSIFDTVETASMEELTDLSAKLWAEHTYDEGEEDRIVLHVGLSVSGLEDGDWNGSISLDQTGSGWQTAMARTVSLTGAQAVKAVLQKRLKAGVQPAPSDIAEGERWLNALKDAGINITQKYS